MTYRMKKIITRYILMVCYIFAILFIVASGNKKIMITTINTNSVKSINSSRIIYEYDTTRLVKSVSDIKEYGPQSKIMFNGTLTGYGPDCKANPNIPGSQDCGGVVACAPYQDVRNGNIYYEDKSYGKVRIVASDNSIPCGSIVRISNFKFIEDGENFYAITLDRGISIVGLTMDLLYSSEKETEKIGRQKNISFEIVRWGW